VLSPLLFNIVLKFLASSIRHEEEIKWIQIGKEEEKLSLFADDVILFLRDPNNCTNKNLVEIINSFGKVAGYKINIQHLFHIPKMHRPRKKSEKKISFTIASNTIQYLGINFTKEIKDLFNKNNKPLKKLKRTSKMERPSTLVDW
jgi:DNA polymerase III delta subunit